MPNDNSCPFCVSDPKIEMADRLIVETERFYVIPTLGQIVDGYVLIIPKRHAACFGDLTDDELAEYETLHTRVRYAIESAFDLKPTAFEHGVVGQTVKHAHMHLAPLPYHGNLWGRIDSKNPYHESWSAGFVQLQEQYAREGVYLFMEGPVGDRYLFKVRGNVPPQYLRVLVADEVGHPERANWRTMDQTLDSAMQLNTRNRLRKLLA